MTRAIGEMVGAAPVCPPERPRSGVSIRKGHIPTRKGGVSMRRNVCALRMMHTRYRWMRPCRATRAGTQAPPLPTSIKPLCHATSLVLIHRRSLFRQPFLDLVHRRSLFRQPFLVFVHRRSLFRQPSSLLSVGKASSGNLFLFLSIGRASSGNLFSI